MFAITIERNKSKQDHVRDENLKSLQILLVEVAEGVVGEEEEEARVAEVVVVQHATRLYIIKGNYFKFSLQC